MSRRIRTGPPRRQVDEWGDPVPGVEPDELEDGPLSSPEELGDDGSSAATAEDPNGGRPRPSLRGLSIAGFSRRRVGWLVGAALTMWIVVVFARQVGEGSAKASEANQARVANAELATNVAALQRELDLIQRPAFVEQQAHALGLGGAKDHAFTLDPNAPPLASDAPGSAAVRLGAPTAPPSALDSWLDVLFGPPPGT